METWRRVFEFNNEIRLQIIQTARVEPKSTQKYKIGVNRMYKIIKNMDCWGTISYFGYKDGKQHTEDHWSISDLIEHYPDFKDATVIFKGNNDYNLENSKAGKWKFRIIEGIEHITENIVEQIENFKDSIFFNDNSGKHWIFDFKIDDIWIEAKKVDCNNMVMNLILWK